MFKLPRRPAMTLARCSVAVSMMLSGAALAQQAPLFNPEHSVARNWNDTLLFSIRNDFARPTVHARNLFHTSAMMYDLWASYTQGDAVPYFLGVDTGLEACALNTEQEALLQSTYAADNTVLETAISMAMYRVLQHRFAGSPNLGRTLTEIEAMAIEYGIDRENTSADFSEGSAEGFGNYIANCVITYGLSDGANEQQDYANTFYTTANPPLDPRLPGNPMIADPNRWQPLQFDEFIDQAGNLTEVPPFLGAEWGEVLPFALQASDLVINERDGQQYYVYHDPGMPALLAGEGALPAEYQWGHALVALWSAHLDPTDGVMIDISPASIGNTTALPTTIEGLRSFYNDIDGGSTDRGHAINPFTNAPYEPQMVPRGDYSRVLAEFWADGPDSETPPGHWFTILNEAVSSHPAFERRFRGEGQPLDALEWDIKAYFTLGGGVHDAAISAWGIKGWYDYVRPVSAIRHMADLGQSSDPQAASYDPQGIPLTEGLIEVVAQGDPLAGEGGEHIGKIKLFAWRGPNAIEDPDNDVAGVDWILAENWWPYQRPSFVTPPFAGYVSGHSTFSRAAAEVLTLITGDEYFPGGMGEFVAQQNEFLVFEDGPSVDIVLQWATYRDASDQTSLSRIWGGIHPPVDDVPGRLIGIEVGNDAFALATRYFDGTATSLPEPPAPPPPPPAPAPTPPPAESGGSGGGSLWVLPLLGLAGLFRRRR